MHDVERENERRKRKKWLQNDEKNKGRMEWRENIMDRSNMMLDMVNVC